MAGQRADVDLEVDAVGDHVDLRAAVGDRRRERRVGAGVELAGHAHRQRVARVDEAVGVEQRADQLLRVLHALEELPPDVVDLGGGLVLGDAADDLGRLDQGVVGLVGLAAVAGRARDPERAQWLPFSATITGSFRPVGLGIGMPPDSVIT